VKTSHANARHHLKWELKQNLMHGLAIRQRADIFEANISANKKLSFHKARATLNKNIIKAPKI